LIKPAPIKAASLHIPEERKKKTGLYVNFSVLKPDWLFLFHSMKRKQKSCQNEPSAGRFDGLPTHFDEGNTSKMGCLIRELVPPKEKKREKISLFDEQREEFGNF
jgi:hypothetical protein